MPKPYHSKANRRGHRLDAALAKADRALREAEHEIRANQQECEDLRARLANLR